MDKRTKYALVLTALYGAVICGVVSYRFCEFWNLPLNSLGDFLAGAFGPLALAWVVFGYFQQGDELKSSVQQLEIQAKASQQLFEFERNKWVEQKDEQRKKMRPKLDLKCLADDRVNSDLACRFDLANNGARVTSLKVFLIANGLRHLIHSASVFDDGDRASFKWTIYHAGVESHFDLEIVYVEGDLSEGSQNFSSFVRTSAVNAGKTSIDITEVKTEKLTSG